MKTMNKVLAGGKVMKRGRNEDGFYEIKILTDFKNKRFVYFALREPLDPEIGIGDVVDIEGYIKSFSYKDEETDKFRKKQFFIAQKVKKAKTCLEKGTGYKGKFCGPGYCDIYLVGEFHSSTPTSDKWARVNISTAGKDSSKDNIISLNYITQGQLPGLKRFKRGDVVALHCQAEGKIRTINGQNVVFENIFVQDIALVQKADGDNKADTK